MADLVLDAAAERDRVRAVNDRSIERHARLNVGAVWIFRNEDSIAKKVGGVIGTEK